MKQDTLVEYLGEESLDQTGVLWYKIKLNNNLLGWANAKYLKEQ